MNKTQEIKDIAKEVFTILTYFEPNSLEKIPNNFLENLMLLAADSNCNFQIDVNKTLSEQNISEESKDLLALIYYTYLADSKEKKSLEKAWYENEKIFQQELSNKYDPNNLFKNTKNTFKSNVSNITIYKKHNFIQKLFYKIKNWFILNNK